MGNPDLLLIFAFVIVVLLILVGGFVVRPFLKQLAEALDRYLSQKSLEERDARKLDAVHDRLESLDQRMALMEERLEFAEALLTEERDRPGLASGPDRPEPEGEPDARAGGNGG